MESSEVEASDYVAPTVVPAGEVTAVTLGSDFKDTSDKGNQYYW